MALTAAERSEEPKKSVGNTILILSQAGAVCNVLEADDDLRQQIESSDKPIAVDEVWTGDAATAIKAALKRTIRTRKSQNEHFLDAVNDRSYDATYIAQGPDRVMMIVRDLSDEQHALSRVHRLAYTDETTGLPNRDYLFDELGKITDMQRLKEGRAAMICIHVGQFDDHGWVLNSSQQDEVLRELATRMTTHLRGSNDGENKDSERYSVAARTDFRQFGIVLPSIESGEDAESVADRVVHDLKQPVTISTRTVTVSACAGVALFPQDGVDAAALFESASAAMEDARNEPDCAYKFHSGTVRLRTLQRQDLEVELKSALQKEEYALNYLPIVSAGDGRPCTMEALLRWPDTVLGTQPTRKVVRVAERTGLIVQIGEWVTRRACEQLQQWHKEGHTHLRVAINLSSQEIACDGIADRFKRILEETGTDPADVDVELKEHMLFREVLKDYATCRELAALGLRIVVDDYGVGASSLAHLAQSPAKAIKIDNTFTANLENNERDRVACKAAMAMARELGIEAIAEGVETEKQAQILREAGCEFLQGFYFCRPMADAEASDYLAAHSKATAD